MVDKAKLEEFFEKYPGGYFAILTAIAGGLTVMISSILYYIGEPFTFSSHWISHLGAGPNGSGLVFTIGFIITSIFAVPFLIYLNLYMREGMEGHKLLMAESFIASMIAIAGLIVNAIWNMGDDPYLHITGSTTFFFGGFFMVVFYCIWMFLSSKIPTKQAAVGLIVACIFAAFLISFLPTFGTEDLFILLTSTDPIAGVTRFIEWIVFFAIIAWFFEMGIYTLKNK